MPRDADSDRGRPSLRALAWEPPRPKFFRVFLPGADSTRGERHSGILVFVTLAFISTISVLAPPRDIPRVFAEIALASSVVNLAAMVRAPRPSTGRRGPEAQPPAPDH